MSPVSSFDQLQSSGTDRTLSEGGPNAGCQRPERDFFDRTCQVSADRMLVRI